MDASGEYHSTLTDRLRYRAEFSAQMQPITVNFGAQVFDDWENALRQVQQIGKYEFAPTCQAFVRRKPRLRRFLYCGSP